MPLENGWEKEIKIDEHIPISHMLEPTIFETKQGDVGSVIEFEGYDFETSSLEELNIRKRLHQHVIAGLSEHISLTYFTIRRHQPIDLNFEFDNQYCKKVNHDYYQQFKDNPFYVNTLYIVILHRGPAIKLKGWNFFQSEQYNALKKARQVFRNHVVGELKKTVSQFIILLNEFKPKLIGEQDSQTGFSELLSLFGFLISGHWRHYRAYDENVMQQTAFDATIYPEASLSKAISDCRLFFGQCIQMGEQSPRFANVLAIKSYASKTHPLLLEKLLHLPVEMVICHHFLVEKNQDAFKKIERTIYRYDAANNKAASLIDELSTCQDDLAADRLIIGNHQHTIMILGDSIKSMEKHVDLVHSIYNEAGFRLSNSALAIEPLFWSQLPGNKHFLTHLSLITSENIVDFCPLFNYASKKKHHTHLKAPIAFIKTSSQTALPFHYHAAGSVFNHDLTPGHTTIIGGNGSGKTVLLGFMDAQIGRFQGRSFFFDRNRGMEIYIRAAGGRYFRFDGEKNPSSVSLNPFSLPDTKMNRDFLKTWLGSLIQTEHEAYLPAELLIWIHDCVDFVYDEIEPHLRTLSVAVMRLPVDFSRWMQLNPWLRGNAQRSDGPYAWLFDNPVDQLDIEHVSKIGFDLTALLQQPSSVLMSTCFYLMHRIKLCMDGRLVSIVFDEGWQILDHPFWKHQLKQDLPTLRKLNAHIILSTQSPSSVINSSLSAQILDNCATQIFFCNAMADALHYKNFQLSEHEFDFIKNTPKEKRLWIYKQDQSSVIASLPLGHMSASLAIWSATQHTLNKMDECINQVGEDVSQWLPLWLKSQGLYLEGFS